jgi:hypothetical protein
LISGTPKVSIEMKVDKSSINANDYATITIITTNNDLLTHNINFQFDASPKITFYAGRESALQNNAYAWSMDATTEKTTKTFTLTGTLGEQETSTTFPVELHVIVDGSELRQNWEDFSIVIKG